MKKIMAIFLAVIMVMTIVIIPVSAAEADNGLYTAPVFYGTQKRTNDNGTIDIRFVSVTNTLAGAKLGYEITAYWWDAAAKDYREIVYSAANGHSALETSVIYTSVEAGEETVTATDLGAKLGMSDARGVMAVAINGVPTSIEVLFSVKTYVKDAEGAIVATTESKELIYANGERSAEKVISNQNFNNVTVDATKVSGDSASFNAAIAALGWKDDTNHGGMSAGNTIKSTDDGKIQITTGAQQRFVNIVPAGAISSAKDFTLAMDITINKCHIIDILPISGYNAVSGGTTRDSVGIFQFRVADSADRNNTSGDYSTGYLTVNPYKMSSTLVNSDLGLTGTGMNQEFRLAIKYDLINKTATMYVNGVEICSFANANTFDGGLAIGGSNSVFTIDNLTVTSTPYVKTEKVLYSDDFNEVTVDATKVSGDSASFNAAIAALGWKDDTNHGGMSAGNTIKSTDDGKIQITTGAQQRFVNIVPANTIPNNADSFTIEMDITINKCHIIDILPISGYNAVSGGKTRDSVGIFQFRSASTADRNNTSGDYSTGYLVVNPYKMSSNLVNSDLGLTGTGMNQEFHLTIKYDMVNDTATMYVNYVEICTFNNANPFDGGIAIGGSNSVFTIDNLVIKAVQ